VCLHACTVVERLDTCRNSKFQRHIPSPGAVKDDKIVDWLPWLDVVTGVDLAEDSAAWQLVQALVLHGLV